MTGPQDDLIVVPLNRLPSERNGEDVEEEKRFIREKILGVSNEQLVNDKETFKRMAELGSDLMINAFACNFKIKGVPNQDVGEASYLNERIFQRLSVTKMDDVVGDRPLFLTSSSFEEEAYGRCLVDFKRRLQLGDGTTTAHGALSYLINVTMSPWPTDSPFLGELAQSFKEIAEEEVQRCIIRNEIKPSLHRFVMQGFNRIYLVYMPMFHMADHRQQLIITADFPPEVQELYQQLRNENPDKTYTTANVNPVLLSDLLKPGADVEYRMDEGIPDDDTQPLMKKFKLSNINVVINKSLSFDALESTYPERMLFYLYGTEDECHIDHVLKKAPNAQISVDRIEMNLSSKLSDEQLAGGVIAVLEDVYETSIQPLPLNQDESIMLESPGLALVAGRTHKASVYSSYGGPHSKRIATGNITLQGGIFADWKGINGDPSDPGQSTPALKWPSQRA
ncbi:hypothetical protein F5Y04DRAFT_257607 [Hypomontagnella monticulosa]|nr:hypothetical protein F5Y04DRAFT_257607 [Hypomontagnella monticulosa]